MLRKTLLTMACAALALGACGPTATAPAPPSAGGSGAVSFMISADPAERAAFDALVAAFHTKHPEITVEIANVPGEEEFRQRLIANLTTGTPSDVILFDYELMTQFFAKNVFTPLAPYLAQSQVIREADFYPQAMTPFVWHGQLMCVPLNVSSDAVYYNKGLFDAAKLPYPQPGWTWDDFLRDAQALTLPNQGQYGTAIAPELIALAPFVWQNGGELVDDPAKPTRLALDTPEASTALKWVLDLSNRYHVIPSEREEKAQDSESRFLGGKTGMYFSSRKLVVAMRATAQFDWDVAPLPQGKQAASVLHSDGYCVTAQSQNKAGAWAFIEFANSVEGQTILAGTGRTVPSLKAVAESPAFLAAGARPEHSQVWLDQIPYLHSLPLVSAWGEVEERTGAEFTQALYGAVTPDQAIRNAIDQTTSAFAGADTP